MVPHVIIARIGWMALGSALTLISKSDMAKEATSMFKEGVDGLMVDYKRDLKKNKDLVNRVKSGKQ